MHRACSILAYCPSLLDRLEVVERTVQFWGKADTFLCTCGSDSDCSYNRLEQHLGCKHGSNFWFSRMGGGEWNSAGGGGNDSSSSSGGGGDSASTMCIDTSAWRQTILQAAEIVESNAHATTYPTTKSMFYIISTEQRFATDTRLGVP